MPVSRPISPLRAIAALGVLAAAMVVLAGCGSSSSSGSSGSSTTESGGSGSSQASTTATSTSSGSTSTTSTSSSAAGGGEDLAVSADPSGELKFTTDTLSAKAGKVAIDFTNGSPESHNLTLENSSGKTLGATETFDGGSKTLSLDLKPGVYKFFCSVPGHRMAGMEGTLTVH